MIFTRDFVTRENHRQIASLVTQKSLFTVTHALFFISCHAMYIISIQVMNQFDLPDLICSKILCFQHGHSTCHWFPIVYIFNGIKLYLQNPQTLIMDVSHLLLCSVALVHWHFIDNIFKCISLNKNHNFFQLFLGFVCNGLIDNTSALVCLMACTKHGVISRHLNNVDQVSRCHMASPGHNHLIW